MLESGHRHRDGRAVPDLHAHDVVPGGPSARAVRSSGEPGPELPRQLHHVAPVGVDVGHQRPSAGRYRHQLGQGHVVEPVAGSDQHQAQQDRSQRVHGAECRQLGAGFDHHFVAASRSGRRYNTDHRHALGWFVVAPKLPDRSSRDQLPVGQHRQQRALVRHLCQEHDSHDPWSHADCRRAPGARRGLGLLPSDCHVLPGR